jgi:hypothetical protein
MNNGAVSERVRRIKGSETLKTGTPAAVRPSGVPLCACPCTTAVTPVQLCPPEEMIWSKGYVQERERFDGADIAHMIRSRGEAMDWGRLLRRFGAHWRVLFSHIVLFGFIYPSERGKIPAWVLKELSDRIVRELEEPPCRENICFGTLLSREQYLADIGKWNYHDARVRPVGQMSPEEIAHWTAAIVDAKTEALNA